MAIDSSTQKKLLISLAIVLGAAFLGSIGYLGYQEWLRGRGRRCSKANPCPKGHECRKGLCGKIKKPATACSKANLTGTCPPGLKCNSEGTCFSGPVSPNSSRPSSMMPDNSPYASAETRYDLLEGGRRRSTKATGYSADDDQSCMSQNIIGSYQAPTDLKVGSSRPYMPSAPMGSKPQALSTNRLSGARRGKSMAGTAKRTRVDLSDYARMGVDRSMGAKGLDLPEDLALASAQLGHIEVAANTRTDTTHVWGETPSSWQIGYSVNTSGMLEPGNGVVPVHGPAQLALRQRGVSY